jgi:hypothetical protein
VADRQTKSTVFERTWPVPLSPPAPLKISTTWKPDTWPAGGYLCKVELLADGRPIDSVIHEIHVWRPGSDKHYITVADGQFMLDGARWRANGVNYMPTSGTAHESYTYFREFLSAASYDPEVIARDLANVRGMGFNAISIFLLHQNTRDQNLLDLLRQADGAGLKVNLSVLPTTPMDFQADKVREIVEYCRLAEHDEVFALDVDWEPMFGPQVSRARWDKEWETWIAERYGSVEAAERDWQFKAPRTPAGAITNPTAEQIDTDGPWRVMVAAYRRFLDTLLYQKYGPARDFIRTLDPHHLVSFRMAYAGDPTYRNQGWMPYDFPYLAAAVDFLAPEGYGRIGDWERVKPGWFEVCYARWADPGKPVVWAEAGVSAWDASRMCSMPAAMQFQADFYEHFYKMLIASASDGVFWWYYPGGYRNEERSDFGIINPDGSDRPVTRIIRNYGPKFLAGPPAKPPDTWIAVDRDAHSAGVSGIYESVQRQFWQAIDAGHTPGLKTAGTGTDSGNCPALAVGNVPLTGANPPKYLDAAFDRVEIRDATGQFVTVAKGGQVKVRSDQPVVARITLRNLGEAAWLPGTPTGTGAVRLIVDGTQAAPVPIPRRVEHLQTIALDNLILAPAGLKQPTRITLSLKAENRSPFGERFSLTLIP